MMRYLISPKTINMVTRPNIKYFARCVSYSSFKRPWRTKTSFDIIYIVSQSISPNILIVNGSNLPQNS